MSESFFLADIRRMVVVTPSPVLSLALGGAGTPGRDGPPGTSKDASPSAMEISASVRGSEAEAGIDEYGTARFSISGSGEGKVLD